MNMHNRKYRLSVAAKASGWDLGLLRANFQRGHFEFREEDDAPAKTGAAGQLSLRSVITLALARRLVDNGAPTRAAFLAGMKFSFFSTRSAENIYDAERGVGELFDQERFSTLLALFPNGESDVIPWPRQGKGPMIDSDDMLSRLISPPHSPAQRSSGSIIIVVEHALRDLMAVLSAITE
jgi:hypothetical protein